MTQNHGDQQTLTFAGCKSLQSRHATRTREAQKMARSQGPSSGALLPTSYGGSAGSLESLESFYRTATSIPCKCSQDDTPL